MQKTLDLDLGGEVLEAGDHAVSALSGPEESSG